MNTASAWVAMIWTAAASLASTPPPWTEEVAALRAYASDQGERLWEGFGAAPFGVLLVEAEQETLICHPETPEGFAADGEDEATGCPRLVRARSDLPDNLMAAFPIFGPPSTIVIGTPEATGASPGRWRSTLLHEHFHQWQDGLPGIHDRVAALDLAGDDRTGMWMLNFPFPYAEAPVAAAHAEASRALAAAVAARGSDAFGARLSDYLARRRAFAAAAGARSWRYFEFQLWREGVARWTEIALGLAADDPAMRADAEERMRRIAEELEQPDLPGRQRTAVYAYGAAEAMLLEACGPGWRTLYPELLALGPLLDQAGRTCTAVAGAP